VTHSLRQVIGARRQSRANATAKRNRERQQQYTLTAAVARLSVLSVTDRYHYDSSRNLDLRSAQRIKKCKKPKTNGVRAVYDC
jgi:hypothetical protein